MSFSSHKGITTSVILLSSFLINGCSYNQKIDKPLQITSCTELAENMGYFQKNCQTNADCMKVSDPKTFCYSETIHIDRKDEYNNLYETLNCPNDKLGQNDRGDYCKIDWKSQNYCNKSNGMCTPGKQS